jgi:uncharacterized protein YkwD
MNSPGHRTNILQTQFVNAGFAWTNAADGTTYWTQVFAKPM